MSFTSEERTKLYIERPNFSFPEIASKMANHLRRFVTAPLPIFEFEFTTGTRTPPPLVAAAKSLALCIDVSLSHVLPRILAYIPSACAWR